MDYAQQIARRSTCLGEVGDAQHEADGVKDVGLATAIQPSDRVEVAIKLGHCYPLCIGLEAVYGYFLYIHDTCVDRVSAIAELSPLLGREGGLPDVLQGKTHCILCFT